MSSLPPEIITDILTRLPVKSLLRFRCVSKPWCYQIDDPHFIKLHLTHSITTGSNLSPITESIGTLYSLDSDALENLVKIETPFINPHKTIVYNTCNGLLLVQPDDGKHLNSQSLFLFNPSTRKHLLLPCPPPINIIDYGDAASLEISNCLGYDFINDDYKVFNFLELIDKALEFITCEARIYSFQSNEWHSVKNFTKGMIVSVPFKAYVNGALHTFDYKGGRHIVALDVGKEDFNLIQIPNFEDKNAWYYVAHVFDGCLALSCFHHDNRTDIWVMKEYGVKESWSMFLSIKSEYFDQMVVPLVYTKRRTEVLLSYNFFRQLVWYDLRKRTFRDFQIIGLPGRFSPIVCVESLVSVAGTGKEESTRRGEIEGKDCQEQER